MGFLMNCVDCGVEIEAQRKTRRFCTPCLRNYNTLRSRAAYVPTDKTRTCTRCSTEYQGKSGKFCPPCRKEVARQKGHAYVNRPDVKERRYAATREYQKTWRITKYGITLEEYAQMLTDQGGGCAICATADDLCIDHDHDTGLVRGILCRRCNAALGGLKDSPELVLSAAKYLYATTLRNQETLSCVPAP